MNLSTSIWWIDGLLIVILIMMLWHMYHSCDKQPVFDRSATKRETLEKQKKLIASSCNGAIRGALYGIATGSISGALGTAVLFATVGPIGTFIEENFISSKK